VLPYEDLLREFVRGVDVYRSLLLRDELRDVDELREGYCFIAREALLLLEGRSIPDFCEEIFRLWSEARESVFIDPFVLEREG
jgi:hypothetical protein